MNTHKDMYRIHAHEYAQNPAFFLKISPTLPSSFTCAVEGLTEAMQLCTAVSQINILLSCIIIIIIITIKKTNM